MTILLTDSETKVLKALRDNHYGEGECTWAFDVNHSESPSGITGKALAAVIGSLQKKGLISCEGEGRDAAIWTKPAGTEAMKTLG